MQLRLTPDQIQEKREAEASIAEAQSELDEAEEGQREAPAAELKSRQQKLEQLMQDFQVRTQSGLSAGSGCIEAAHYYDFVRASDVQPLMLVAFVRLHLVKGLPYMLR